MHSQTAAAPADEPLYPHLWTLIQFDTREFFNVLSLAFADSLLTSDEKHGVVDVLLRMMVDSSGFTRCQVTLRLVSEQEKVPLARVPERFKKRYGSSP